MSYTTLAFGFSDVGGGEIILIGIIALLLFGKNLPSVSRNIGKALAEFKRTLSAASSEIKREMDAAAADIEATTREIKKDNPLADIQKSISAPLDTPATVSTELAGSTDESERPKFTAPAVSNAAALDALPRNIPAPTKIPPPVV